MKKFVMVLVGCFALSAGVPAMASKKAPAKKTARKTTKTTTKKQPKQTRQGKYFVPGYGWTDEPFRARNRHGNI